MGLMELQRKVPTPRVAFMMSVTDASRTYSHESCGIKISCPPKFSHVYRAKKARSVVKSRGRERYHGLFFRLG